VFKLEDVYVEDKKVGDALRALLGIVIGVPKAIPIINAELQHGQVKQQTNGKLVTMFLHHLHQNKIDSLRPADIREWLKKQGMSPSSSAYVVKLAIRAGAIRRTGMSSQTAYHVVKLLPKPTKGGK
jgi:hypothetical protein